MAKRQTLNYDSAELTNTLKQSAGRGMNAFFPDSPPPSTPSTREQPDKQQPATPTPKRRTAKKKSKSASAPTAKQSLKRPVDTPPPDTTLPIDTPPQKNKKGTNVVKTSRSQDVTHDVITSLLNDVDTKQWRAIIEETEVHNSSLRLSLKEREQIEDLVRDLKRTYKIKTSMNEIARLGLLFLAHEFKKNGAQSIIADVKTS